MGARAVEFSRGVQASKMRGSEHNDAWQFDAKAPELEGSKTAQADGALGGEQPVPNTSCCTSNRQVASREQTTLHLPSGEQRPLQVGGRRPVLDPETTVVEAIARLVVQFGNGGGFRALIGLTIPCLLFFLHLL